jgi:hypothetical protein
MQVVRKDDVSIYNLTRGKQLPDWLSERKRRKLQQEDTEIQVALHSRCSTHAAHTVLCCCLLR